jgi:hypothetical protein
MVIESHSKAGKLDISMSLFANMDFANIAHGNYILFSSKSTCCSWTGCSGTLVTHSCFHRKRFGHVVDYLSL